RFDRKRGGEGSLPGARAEVRRCVPAFTRTGAAGASVRGGGVRWLLAAIAAQPSLPAEAERSRPPEHGAQRTARGQTCSSLDSLRSRGMTTHSPLPTPHSPLPTLHSLHSRAHLSVRVS